MIENNNFELLRLCSLLEQRHKAELAWQRATYRVSYYRKIKARLETKNKNNFSTKWANNALELVKKIETARIISLRKNRDFVKVKDKLRKPIATCCKKANASLMFQDGKIIGIRVVTDKSDPQYSFYEIPESKFADMAAQYEANKAMNKMLISGS